MFYGNRWLLHGINLHRAIQNHRRKRFHCGQQLLWPRTQPEVMSEGSSSQPKPPHHSPNGRFNNPWATWEVISSGPLGDIILHR